MYFEFYKLKRDPFLLTPDPWFLYLAEPHRKALLAINRAVAERKGFMVLTGDAGTGKTTLLNLMLYRLSRLPTVSSAFVVNPLLSRDELLETILEEFEIPCNSNSKPKRLQALQNHLIEVQKRGGTSVLIIDEAHLLTVDLLEEIRLLGNLDSFGSKPLQVILCGQPELASVLLDTRLKALCQRITLIARLRPLGVDEVAAYVKERLELAGLQGDNLFSPAALAEIRHRTNGVPRLINLLCDSCLRSGAAAQAWQIGPEVVNKAASLISLTHGNGELDGPARENPRPVLEEERGGIAVVPGVAGWGQA